MVVTENTLFPSYTLQDWQQGYQSQYQESDYWIENIEGEIPITLKGTLFRNGPGLLDIHGTPIRHPFDGDGMVCSIAFAQGKAYFRNRFVRTEAFVQEQEAGKILYRGVFGTQKPGGWWHNAFDFRLKNIANTNVIYWGDKLLALWEAAEPYRLDPHTLETLGIDYLDGILQPGEAFAAHPWVDPSCSLDNGAPCLVNFALKVGLSSQITLYEFNPEGKLLRRHAHNIPGFSFIHDFAITPNYAIFFQNPVAFNPLPFLFGWQGAGECVKFQRDRATRIILIPRTPPYNQVKVLETKAGFVFHHANAFELEDKLVVDSICYQTLPELDAHTSYQNIDFNTLDPGQLWRFTLDLTHQRVEQQMINPRCCEFPTLNGDRVGRSYRYVYLGAAHHPTGNAPLQGIIKWDWQTGEEQLWSFAPKGYVSEPIFVAKPDAKAEDDGWLLTLVYDATHHRSDLVILDAQNLIQGPIATLHLKYHIPYGLHGSWTNKLDLVV